MNQKLVGLVCPKRNNNSLYKHVKSRYLEKDKIEKQRQDKPKHEYLTRIKEIDSNNAIENIEFDFQKIKNDRVQWISLADKCYIELLDYDTYLDFINLIFILDDRRQKKNKKYKCGPSIISEPTLLSNLHDLLKFSESPIDMLQVTFIVNRYRTKHSIKDTMNQWFTLPENDWLWVAEVIMLGALAFDSKTHNSNGDNDNRPESAVFWYAGGVFYCRNGCTEIAMEYLEKARTIANGPNKLIFPSVPSDLHIEMKIGKYEQFVKEPYSVWTLACLHLSGLLKKTAIRQEPKTALKTLNYALKLLKASSEPDSKPRILIAEVYYDIGLKYKAIDSTKLSVHAFHKCFIYSENVHRELDLMAKFMVMRVSQNPPTNWSYLELKEEAKNRLNLRVLVKAIVALGMVAQKKEQFEDGFHHFGVAEWMSRNKTIEQNVDSLDIEIAIFNMAICRTKRFIQLFPKPNNYEARFRMNDNNQWTYPEEKIMYCKVEKEVRELYKLFKFHFDDSDENEKVLEEESEECFENNDDCDDDQLSISEMLKNTPNLTISSLN
ncbi:uncharacterized protein LOC113557893 [Rhopalosiphum maidis]|uniref:uncharacterized protein LOC113557893 n=1 Tax=Rhopalosiphum maidis TaxID=43146 RepID=UPI000EFE7E61|nr:uncharacterized protein LOC113557893 [Rhopalosiphum maidis]